MIEAILFLISLVGVAVLAYVLGITSGKAESKATLVTERSVRHNLNCLVCDLRHEVKELKPDALAYNQSKGLWCTDQPDLIRHHAKKERFFRLGYPEHKL